MKFHKIISSLLILVFVFFTTANLSYAITPIEEPSYQGIDVSNWQGYIDYNQVKNAGIQIVYMKTSQGTTFKDPYFESNYQKAKANGLKVGFYHFLTATNTQEAEREANFFASVIAGKEPDCKLAMDYEQFNGVPTQTINDIALTFLQKVQQLTGKQVIIYSNLYDSKSVFSKELARQYQLWLAYYGDYTKLGNNSSNWENWIGVQYTSRGKVPGINGYVDRNVFTNQILLDSSGTIPEVPIPEPGDDLQTVYYTVKRGDTLSQIAQNYGTTVQEIVRLNGISNPSLIYPGQVLTIKTNQNIESGCAGSIIYTIQRGDTLSQIAIRYQTTITKIVTMNQIQNPNLIYPGQQIRICRNETDNDSNSQNVIYYRVRRGDNISRIANYYQTTVNQIVIDNGIQNANLIYPCQVLKIVTNGNTTNTSGNTTYVVRRGDSLWRIANYYGVSVQYLVNLNGIRNPNLIYPGQILKI